MLNLKSSWGIIALFIGLLANAQIPIYDIQYTTDPSGNSPYMNQTGITTQGIVTAIFFTGYIIADAPGPWHSLYVYSQKNGPEIGDEVSVTGRIVEYYNMTEMDTVTSFQLISTGNTIAPAAIDCQSMSQEKYESVLVRVSDVSVTRLETYQEWTVNDGSGDARCGDMRDYMYFPIIGDYLDYVTGVVFYSYSSFKIEPRGTFDISGSKIYHYALKGDVVTMNDSRDVLADSYIEIRGDQIIGITSSPPSGIEVVDTAGLIFPGLIDAHNHPIYNVLDWIPFPCTFTERYEWQDEPLYSQFSTQFRGIRDYNGSYANGNNLWKLAEIRALCAGTTMIQGYNCNADDDAPISKMGIGINNAERFPSRIYSSTFPLQYQSDWNTKKGQYWDRFVIHLCEGFSAAALTEFDTWSNWGLLDWRTSIIHGVPLGTEEWTTMANANASLIWSPRSNMLLYNTTADIPGALSAGVNVALAPDWTESGEANMLAELRYGNEVNQSLWSGIITPLQFAEFATRNAAFSLGMEDRAGQVAVGFEADLMVIPGDPSNPYESLMEADPAEVKLTVVSGRPMYGDPELIDQFDFLTLHETISICGQVKKLAHRIVTNGVTDSSKPIADVVDDLLAAYNAVSPKVCDFIHFDPCGGGPTPTPSPTSSVPTYTPTPPPPPTFTPTTAPGEPTNTPVIPPTSTPSECEILGVMLWMPGSDFTAGDPCSLIATACNPNAYSYEDLHLFVILQIVGSFYFAPSFGTELDNYDVPELTPGSHTTEVIPEFTWPENTGAFDGVMVYGALTDSKISKLVGDYDIFTFGWH